MFSPLCIPAIPSLVGLGLLACFASFIVSSVNRRKRPPLPPGPPPKPFVGNLLDLPNHSGVTYLADLVRQYGGFASLQLGSQTLIILGEVGVAKLVLEKRAAKYSTRSQNHFVERYYDTNCLAWGMSSSPTFPDHAPARRLSLQSMGPVREGATEASQERETWLLAQQLMKDPSSWMFSCERWSLASACSAALDISLGLENDPLVHHFCDVMVCIERAYTPDSSIINLLPVLDRLPGPMPWRQRGGRLRAHEDQMWDELFALAPAEPKEGTWAEKFQVMGRQKGLKMLRGLIAAAVDTTAHALQTFILACMVYPDWIPQVQQDLDRIIGPDRLPNFGDRQHLPSVEAVVRELLRWRAPLPAGMPHRANEDDVVHVHGRDYFIPANSTILALSLAIDRDPNRFERPDRFEPSRWIDEKGELKQPYELPAAFGYGHHKCGGVPFAMRSLWISIATILHAFEVRKLPGHVYCADDSAFEGIKLKPFPVDFVPRSERHADAVREGLLAV